MRFQGEQRAGYIYDQFERTEPRPEKEAARGRYKVELSTYRDIDPWFPPPSRSAWPYDRTFVLAH